MKKKKNRLIFERPANNPVGDAKTVTSSEFPAYRGTKMKCIRDESPRNPPLRSESMITRDKFFNAATHNIAGYGWGHNSDNIYGLPPEIYTFARA